MTAADGPGGIRVLRGDPSDEDLAVLLVVVYAAARRGAAGAPPPVVARAGWAETAQHTGQGRRWSAGSWRAAVHATGLGSRRA